MTLRIEIRLDNAAFEDAGELARILGNAAKRLPDPPAPDVVALMDSNGNRVGTATITED